MKYNIGIVGLGDIYRQHILALRQLTQQFQLTTLCDINPQRIEQALQYAAAQLGNGCIQTYTDILQCTNSHHADIILIATPPNTHYDIAQATLQARCHTIIEKPAVLHIEQLRQLFHIAEKHNTNLHIAFHAAYAADLRWFITHRKQTEENYHTGKLRQIDCRFYDPYVNNGILAKGREALGGSYLDSTVNELSVCDMLTPLDSYTTVDLQKQQDNNGITIRSLMRLKSTHDQPDINCETDWTRGINEKTTTLTYDNGTTILIDHSHQTVTLNNNGSTHLLYDNHDAPRLPTQYTNLYTDYHRMFAAHQSNRQQALTIHRLLLEEKRQP